MLENETSPDNTGAETSHEVTASNEPSGNVQSAEPQGQVSDQGQGAGETGSQDQIDRSQPPGSSDNPNTTPQTAHNGQPQQPQIDWQKKLLEVEAWGNKSLQKAQRYERDLQQLQQQYHGIDPNQVRQYQQAQQEAQRRNLRRWDKRHPEHSQFRGLLDRAQTIDRQLASIDPKLPPEAQDAARSAILGALSEGERGELENYRTDARQFQTSLVTDPRGTLAPIIQEEIRSALDSERRRMTAETAVERDLNNPHLAKLAQDPQSNARMSQIMQGISSGEFNPWQVAKHIALLEEAVGSLQSRAGMADKAQAQAQAQKQLLERGASHTRDQTARPVANVFREARRIADERKIPKGDPRFMDIVRDIERKLLNQ